MFPLSEEGHLFGTGLDHTQLLPRLPLPHPIPFTVTFCKLRILIGDLLQIPSTAPSSGVTSADLKAGPWVVQQTPVNVVTQGLVLFADLYRIPEPGDRFSQSIMSVKIRSNPHIFALLGEFTRVATYRSLTQCLSTSRVRPNNIT